jgi:hypothetical protein
MSSEHRDAPDVVIRDWPDRSYEAWRTEQSKVDHPAHHDAPYALCVKRLLMTCLVD